MKIKEILSQNRRDFIAVYICEHCDFKEKGIGYDDEYFHKKVIPDMICPFCNKKSPEDYRPLTTKYPSGKLV